MQTKPAIAAIVNPTAGRRSMLPTVRRIAQLVERAGGAFQTFLTESPGHASRLASHISPDASALLVVGGDGTVGEVINGLAGRQLPIVILRTGTENLLARELRMPTTPHAIVQTLLRGDAFACDAGMLNRRRFLAVAGVGFDAECVLRLSQGRAGHITHWSYFWPIWRTFWGHRFPELTVEIDSEHVFEGQGFVVIGVIRNYSVGLELLPNAEYDDGLLDVCICPCRSKLTLLYLTSLAFRQRLVESGNVIYRQCHSVRVESPHRVPVHIDGDVGGYLPIVCESLPGAATFLRQKRRLSGSGQGSPGSVTD